MSKTPTTEMIEAAQEAYATFGQVGHLRALPPAESVVAAMLSAALQSAAEAPAPSSHVAGETATFFVIEWIAAPRPPVHPNPMTGRQTYRSFERAVLHMKSQAHDAEFISLTERTTVTTSVDRSSDLRAALAATATEDGR